MSNKEKQKNEVTLLGSDDIESPEIIIANDKNTDRRKAFIEANKIVMQIIPRVFSKFKKTQKGNIGFFRRNFIYTKYYNYTSGC